MRLLALFLAALGLTAIGSPSAGAPLPTPTSYAQTCTLYGGCQAVPGHVPRALRRPLHLPKLGPGGACPTSTGSEIDNNQFGGVALGHGSVRPLIDRAGDIKHGIIPFSREKNGWWVVKIDWFAYPRYQGPVFIRGRRLDGAGKVAFGGETPDGAPELFDPQLPPVPTANGTGGWREWLGGTWLRSLGCYAWQIDGTKFSTIIVFKAIRWK